MVDAEKICLKLNGLDTIIAAMIDLKKDVSESVEQYDKLIDTLPSEANEAAASYRQKWASYVIRWSLYQPASKGQEKEPKREDKPPVFVDVPREPAITHDGRVETFYAFWLMMEKRILKRTELDEGAKFGRLYGALSEVDKVNTGGMSLKEAESYLFKRYRSPDAIRRYLQDTFFSLGMRYYMDLKGAQGLADALETAIIVTKSVLPEAPELLVLLFNLVYSRLFGNWQMNYWLVAASRSSDPESLAKYVDTIIHSMLSDQVAKMSVGGPRSSSGFRRAIDDDKASGTGDRKSVV